MTIETMQYICDWGGHGRYVREASEYILPELERKSSDEQLAYRSGHFQIPIASSYMRLLYIYLSPILKNKLRVDVGVLLCVLSHFFHRQE